MGNRYPEGSATFMYSLEARLCDPAAMELGGNSLDHLQIIVVPSRTIGNQSPEDQTLSYYKI